MVVRIRAKLKTGEVIVGPIMGNGGMLGSGALCHGHEIANEQALDVLRISRNRAEAGAELPIFEPKPGFVAIYPDYCAETDGARVDVPFDGTTFSIEPPRIDNTDLDALLEEATQQMERKDT